MILFWKVVFWTYYNRDPLKVVGGWFVSPKNWFSSPSSGSIASHQWVPSPKSPKSKDKELEVTLQRLQEVLTQTKCLLLWKYEYHCILKFDRQHYEYMSIMDIWQNRCIFRKILLRKSDSGDLKSGFIVI